MDWVKTVLTYWWVSLHTPGSSLHVIFLPFFNLCLTLVFLFFYLTSFFNKDYEREIKIFSIFSLFHLSHFHPLQPNKSFKFQLILCYFRWAFPWLATQNLNGILNFQSFKSWLLRCASSSWKVFSIQPIMVD